LNRRSTKLLRAIRRAQQILAVGAIKDEAVSLDESACEAEVIINEEVWQRQRQCLR